ncbi:hypothetical protein [Hymenobacter sp. PAMC 26628]|nr:hypothetical protein [Hymenobacter sp. PAMC 26628]
MTNIPAFGLDAKGGLRAITCCRAVVGKSAILIPPLRSRVMLFEAALT